VQLGGQYIKKDLTKYKPPIHKKCEPHNCFQH